MEVQFLEKYLHKSMEIDALLSSHPLIQRARDPGEICDLFDIISSGKGASILRMLEEALNKRKLRRGIRKYLKKHTKRHVLTADLWKAMELMSYNDWSLDRELLPIEEIMETWTRQMGYPVLTVEVVDGGNFRVTQERFLIDRSKGENQKWSIPVSYIFSNDRKKHLEWLYKERFNQNFRIIAASFMRIICGMISTLTSLTGFQLNISDMSQS